MLLQYTTCVLISPAWCLDEQMVCHGRQHAPTVHITHGSNYYLIMAVIMVTL